jgi:hypothetical protein
LSRAGLENARVISRISSFQRWRLVVEHAPFLTLLLAGIALRWLVTGAYYPILMLQRDAYRYLELAAGEGGAGFRPVLYPLLIKPAVKLHNLVFVAVGQHVLGLAIAVLSYVLLRRLGAGRWLGAAAAAPVLLDAYNLNLEHYLLTETVFQVMVVGALALLLWHPRPALWAIAGAAVLIALAGTTRFVGLALIAPAAIYIAWTRMGWMRLAILAIAFSTVLLGYSAWRGTTSEIGGVAGKSGFFLYGRVASFSDCRKVTVAPDLRSLCLKEPPEERGPNYGFFEMGLPPSVRTGPEAASRFRRFSLTIIRSQPLDYVAAVAADFARFFEPATPQSQEPYVARWRFVRSIEEADPNPYVERLGASPPASLGFSQDFAIDRSLAGALRSYQGVGYLWGPLLGVCLLIGLAGAIWGRQGEGVNLRAASALFTLSAVTLLLIPVAVTVYHFRYAVASLPLAGPAAVAGVLALRARLPDGAITRLCSRTWSRLRLMRFSRNANAS